MTGLDVFVIVCIIIGKLLLAWMVCDFIGKKIEALGKYMRKKYENKKRVKQ